MKLEEFNLQSPLKARNDLLKCCGSITWVDKLIIHFPFSSVESLKSISDKCWYSCTKNDYLEAFSHHPKIGDQSMSDKKHTSTAEWANQEQSCVKNAERNVLLNMAKANIAYEIKFGYIFIICATGKTANEMLNLLSVRLNNEPEKELIIAINEQNKITHLRIDKLFA